MLNQGIISEGIAGLTNKRLSVEIYEQLMNGKAINRSIFSDGELRPNQCFEELLNHFDHYRNLYSQIGYELVMQEGFAFIRTPGWSDQVEDAVRRIQALLLVLFRGAMELGFTMDVLTKDNAGLSNAYLEVIGSGEDKQEVLHACGMKGDTLLSYMKMLESRAIAYRNAKGNLVLTEAGVAFYKELLGEGDIHA
jgi:hypothetical protein